MTAIKENGCRRKTVLLLQEQPQAKVPSVCLVRVNFGGFEEMVLLVFEGMAKLGMVLKDLAKVRVVDLACLVLIPPGGTGVAGFSTKWVGVYGETAGLENGPAGVWGEHKGAGIGVKAVSNTGVGLVAFSHGTAAIFQGDVEVTGDIRLTNADCAEDFDICETEQIEPGTVMVLGEAGKLEQSQKAYDKRVAGVVSGAGDYKPGIVLDKQKSSNIRKPIALLGKVYCKVDAGHGAIEIGDLLTTSPTPGHAMKADDPLKAFGTVIGKAIRPLAEGQGLIPILIALQ